MQLLSRGLFLSLVILNLTACSDLAAKGPFRNREMDYTTQPVYNQYPLQTPAGLTPPQTSPTLVIPPGQNFYPAGPATPMTPPGFNDVYAVPPVPVKYQASTQS